jgi:N-acetylmuramoyl-L-alanine amidase
MAEPKVVKELRGAGKVYNYRGTGVLPPSGGVIDLQLMVEHIPVVRNVQGTQDFLNLARVLRDQGLSLQAATDREGNVALYSRLNRLCWQAKGANQVSCGVEHMHMTLEEEWTREQLRASAWLWQYAEREHGIPMRIGRIASGPGVVRVLRKGHTSHRRVAEAAGFHNRSDPGPGYDWEYVRRAAIFFKEHGHFENV